MGVAFSLSTVEALKKLERTLKLHTNIAYMNYKCGTTIKRIVAINNNTTNP